VLISLRARDTNRCRFGRQHPRVLRVLKTAALSLVPIVLSTSAAYAGSTAANTATLPIAIRSLTVTPATATFGDCDVPIGATTNVTPTTGLVIPGGSCYVGHFSGSAVVQGITITNGGVPGHIDINGGAAVPSDGGTDWALGAAAGANTYTELNRQVIGEIPVAITASPTCDSVFDTPAKASPTGCLVISGSTTTEQLIVDAPRSSTDTSSSFTITTTWTAVP
jgi:hypothetical protein